MDNNIKREIILDHYQNPMNRGLIDNEEYIKTNMNNESCIDDITLMAKIKDHVIEDVRFDAEACAISTAATSIMIKTLLGKTLEEAQEIINNYEHMIEEEPYDAAILGEASVFDDIAKQPSRKKCALLAWWGMKKIIDNQ